MGICRVTQGTQTGALQKPRGVGWGGRWEVQEGWYICIPMAVIHVDIWQRTTKFCKAVIL